MSKHIEEELIAVESNSPPENRQAEEDIPEWKFNEEQQDDEYDEV